MYEQAVFPARLKRHLPHSLNERLRLNVAYCAADFGYDNIGTRLFAEAVYEFLYFVCDVRNYLNRGAEVFPAALLVEHVPIHLAGCEV